jgi:hypothetical protein
MATKSTLGQVPYYNSAPTNAQAPWYSFNPSCFGTVPAHVYTLRFWNIDNVATAQITNSAYTNQQILTDSQYNPVDTGYVDISSYVRPGSNDVYIQLANTTDGWTISYDFQIDGISSSTYTCGVAGSVGCNNNAYVSGVVYTQHIVFQSP